MKSIMTSYCSSLPLAMQYPLGDVVLTVGVKTIARYTGKFSPHLKVKLEFSLVLPNPELITLVLLIPFSKTLDPDQLVSFRGHLIRIYTVFHTD